MVIENADRICVEALAQQDEAIGAGALNLAFGEIRVGFIAAALRDQIEREHSAKIDFIANWGRRFLLG